jgi:hypothetical protein
LVNEEERKQALKIERHETRLCTWNSRQIKADEVCKETMEAKLVLRSLLCSDVEIPSFIGRAWCGKVGPEDSTDKLPVFSRPNDLSRRGKPFVFMVLNLNSDV